MLSRMDSRGIVVRGRLRRMTAEFAIGKDFAKALCLQARRLNPRLTAVYHLIYTIETICLANARLALRQGNP